MQVGEQLLKLHVRGDRASDVLPFPSLQREADILRVLEAGGVPVPHVHGMCPDPPAIVMDAVAGIRDVSQLSVDDARAVAEEYVELLAKIHALPVADFAAIGLDVPRDADGIALGMLEAYVPLYTRTKARPEPLIELALAWARRNVPQNRTTPAFVHFDAGQFLHVDGRITALYDFETCLVGDPMQDLAALRMRNPAEPLGADLQDLYRHYALAAGRPVDLDAVRFHTVVFALVGVMALAGTLVDPLPGSPHLEYVWWDLMQRRTLVWALAECVGVEVSRPQALATTGPDPLLLMLADSIAQLEPTSRQQRYQQRSLALLTACAAAVSAVRSDLDAQLLLEAAPLVGAHADAASAELALEELVLKGDDAHDGALVQLLARQVERSVLAHAPLADRLVGYDLAPVVP
ncbi:MAG: aminoglycoside phosphotransferase [Frankiales bacterium]|nr:aminoglycoside phosphotransferase [Frankiales bacterium]